MMPRRTPLPGLRASTPLGRAAPRALAGRAALAAIGLGVALLDLAAVIPFASPWRVVPALGALALMLAAMRGDRPSMGLVARPVPGWRPWIRVALLLALGMGLVLGAWVLGLHLQGRPLPPGPPLHDADWLRRRLLEAVVVAPLVEEAIYRAALCPPLVAVAGRGPAVFLSGLLFAALHFRYGHPSPENVLGGFVLAGAFVLGGSVLLPLALHSLGNLLVVLLGLAWTAATG